MKYLLLSFTFLLMGISTQGQTPKQKDKDAILAIMDAQETAWNKGDLERFMIGYWKDENLKFIGEGGITYGWAGTLEKYKKSYPNRDAMGTLTFDILHVDAIGKKEMLVVGKWHLQRKEDAPQGYFSLIWKKINKVWVIIADHSS